MKLNRLISIATVAVIMLSLMTINIYAAEDKGGSLLNKIINAITDGADDDEEGYKSPVDFDYYQKKNPDIYAWIEIPGTDIDHPVLQNPDDDEYYTKYSWDNKKSSKGSIFTQATYNTKDFSDPVTLIYGHRTNDGSMFGQLQKTYSDEESFKEAEEIIIYLPDKELHYKVFASLPYGNEHILHYYNFTRLRMRETFFNNVFSASGVGVNINEDNYSADKDGIVILSTCLRGNNNKRYLVLAQLTEEID